MAGLAPFIAGRTTLLITHRASVAAAMDRTVRLEAGRIVDGATDRRLIRLRGVDQAASAAATTACASSMIRSRCSSPRKLSA